MHQYVPQEFHLSPCLALPCDVLCCVCVASSSLCTRLFLNWIRETFTVGPTDALWFTSSFLVVCYRVLCCVVLCCVVLCCVVLSFLVLSCLVLPCLVLSCLVLSCPCPVLSCLVLCSGRLVLRCLSPEAFPSLFNLFWTNPSVFVL